MIQGDQYLLPIEIVFGETTITPDNCEGVMLSVGGVTKKYPGEITFSEGEWLYPLTQQQTLGCHGLLTVQVSVNMGGDFPEIIGSEAFAEPIGENIIGEVWE